MMTRLWPWPPPSMSQRDISSYPPSLLRSEARATRQRRVRKPRTRWKRWTMLSRRRIKLGRRFLLMMATCTRKSKKMYLLLVQHHMAWTINTQSNCHLGKEQKGEKKSSATIAAAAATAVSSSYQALLSSMARFQVEEWWCTPAWMWTIVLAFMAGPLMLVTGQEITYLQLLLLLYLIGFLCQATVLTNPRLRKTNTNFFVWRRSWHWPLLGRGPIHSIPNFANGQNQVWNFGQGRTTTAKQSFGLTMRLMQLLSQGLLSDS